MIFKTEFSTYEVDLDEMKVRRLDSSHDPLPRQGADGEWKAYEAITAPMVGSPVLITWYTETEAKPGLVGIYEVDDVSGVGRCTLTSPVMETL